jgi:hypothetical protein
VSCSRGCCASPAEHYRSLSVAHPERRGWTKTTTDVHDKHTVDVTEHWHDRQDVKVKPETIRVHAEEIGLNPKELRRGAK